MVTTGKLIQVRKNELVGEHFVWGKSTGKVGELVPGPYFQQDSVLTPASEDRPGELVPSVKDSYKLINFESKKAEPVVQAAAKPIRYKLVSEYRRWFTLITVAGTRDGETSPSMYFQCKLSGQYRAEQAQRIWEKEPTRFHMIDVKNLDPKTRGALK